MSGFLKVLLLVLVMLGIMVWLGELLTSVSGSGGGGAGGGDVGADRGEKLFKGKGMCSTCHSFGDEGSAIRCPNLGAKGTFKQPIGVRAAARKQGMSAVKYIVESIYDPNAFVVPGFGKGVMTPIHRPPIALNNDEIASIVMFLLTKSGVDAGEAALAEIRKAQRAYASRGGENETPPVVKFPRGDAAKGLVAFAELECGSCHLIKGVTFPVVGMPREGGVGPALTGIGSIQTRAYLIESIVNPSAAIVADPPKTKPGGKGSYRNKGGTSKMPDFHKMISLRQLIDVAEFLKSLQNEKANKKLYPVKKASPVKPADEPPVINFARGDAKQGRKTFARLKCNACHQVKGVTFQNIGALNKGAGPELTSVGSKQTRADLISSIIKPNAVIVADPQGAKPGGPRSYRTQKGTSKMPNLHNLITLKQLVDVAEFLKSLDGEKTNKERYR